jgi:hypothetical protein
VRWVWGKILDVEALRPTAGSHTAYPRAQQLIVEWYDFGEHARYESANLLVFDDSGQAHLRTELGLPDPLPICDLAAAMAAQFDSYFALEAYASERDMPFTPAVDFEP